MQRRDLITAADHSGHDYDLIKSRGCRCGGGVME